MVPGLWTWIAVLVAIVGFVGSLVSMLFRSGHAPDANHPLLNPDYDGKPLNILLLYGDDWRHDSLGSATPLVQTPFLDELASQGVRFSHNCVTTSICWVSRATLFTGQYLSRHQSTRLNNPRFYTDWDTTSWPALLQKSSYVVGHVGKWQFADTNNFVENAFDFSSIYEGKHQYGNIRAAARTRDDVLRFLDTLENMTTSGQPRRPFAITVAMYPPKAEGDSGNPEEQLRAREEELALYRNVTVPLPFGYTNDAAYRRLPYFFHETKLESRRRWEQIYNTTEKYQDTMKRYYALITEVDKAFRDIVEELKKRGLYNTTLIIFTTDNGYFHAEHGLAGKWFPYQESIRVPLIIRDPRMSTRLYGTVDSSFTLNIDLASTILAAAQVKPPSTMQGGDIADLYLKTSTRWRNEFFYEHDSLGQTYIPATSALVRKEYKYFLWPEWNNTELLFNLEQDPLEQDDLSSSPQHRLIFDEMRARHNELRELAK
jgi:arylsulfatase